MASYPADFIDDSGQVRLSGELDFTDDANAPGGFTGWTQDSADPANVSTNGTISEGGDTGKLDIAASKIAGTQGTVTLDLEASAIVMTDSNDSSSIAIETSVGVQSAPSAGSPAFTANNVGGATVAFDAGGMLVVGFQGLPAADPHVAGQLYTLAGALMVSAG